MYLCMYVNRNQVNFVRKKKKKKQTKINSNTHGACLP